MFGIVTGVMKHPCLTIPYFLMATLLFFTLLAIGGMTEAAEKALPELQKGVCKDAVKFTTGYNEKVDRAMCTELCPCPKSAEKLWTSYSEADLRKLSRTKNAKAMTPAEQSDFKANKEKAKIVPLYFAPDGQKSYSTFEECYSDKL